jgi:glycosyltransferase involved in cell wall biosynthesis
MKVLWFTNIPLPGHTGTEVAAFCTSGGWIVMLLGELCKHADIEIGVVTASPVRKEVRHNVQGVDFIVIPCQKNDGIFSNTHVLRRCAEIVHEWQPDLVHIHGTERLYGLLSARKMIDTPTVISIQGLLGPYSEWYHYFGTSTLCDVIRMHRWVEPIVLRGPLWGLRKYRQGAKVEKEIIQGNINFMGRTLWDRAHVIALNPQAAYYTVGELLRQPFWDSHWCLEKCQRHRILFTNAGHPRKGPGILLDVIPLLKQKYPDIQVAIAGSVSLRSGYGRYIRRRICELGGSAIELGQLTAQQLANEMLASHVFVSPSFIDNSPNAVCEAQLIGMPVVSTYTGGVPSLIEEGRTGLFFPSGDVPMLATRLQELFEGDELVMRLSVQARHVACDRHDPQAVVHQVLAVYEHVLNLARGKSLVPVKLSV